MATRKEEIVASVTLAEALRKLLGADGPKDKSDQITQPIRILHINDSF